MKKFLKKTITFLGDKTKTVVDSTAKAANKTIDVLVDATNDIIDDINK